MTEVINTWQRFAEVTIKTNDLDPMYEVIYKLYKVWDCNRIGRFILHFLLFYNAGRAAEFASLYGDSQFWFELRKDAVGTHVKRGTERRHFRGENAQKAIDNLASFGLRPWELLQFMYPRPVTVGGTPTYSELYKQMTTVFAGTQFGPYFIWKLYDIFNVCLDMPISLSRLEAKMYMPDEPKKAAMFFFDSFGTGLGEVTDYISQLDHPVVPGRKCGLAEAETVLCMMKGFFKTKTHKIGDDTEDKYLQLAAYPELQALLPPWVAEITYQRGELA